MRQQNPLALLPACGNSSPGMGGTLGTLAMAERNLSTLPRCARRSSSAKLSTAPPVPPASAARMRPPADGRATPSFPAFGKRHPAFPVRWLSFDFADQFEQPGGRQDVDAEIPCHPEVPFVERYHKVPPADNRCALCNLRTFDNRYGSHNLWSLCQ